MGAATGSQEREWSNGEVREIILHQLLRSIDAQRHTCQERVVVVQSQNDKELNKQVRSKSCLGRSQVSDIGMNHPG